MPEQRKDEAVSESKGRRNTDHKAKPQRNVRSLLMDLGTVEVEEVTWLWRNISRRASYSQWKVNKA